MFNYKRKIYFGECDQAGIMFYANIFDIMHEAYENIFTNYNGKIFDNELLAYPIVHTEASYIKPLKRGNEITIEILVTINNESSFSVNYTIKLNDNIHIKSITKHLCISKETMHRVELEKELKNYLLSF